MLKKMTLFLTLAIAITGLQTTYANSVSIKIQGIEAKNIYQALTGSQVQQEGAAGHLYRKGKSILCRYTNADMDDSNGNPIPKHDPRRYACSIKFNKNGFAFPGSNP